MLGGCFVTINTAVRTRSLRVVVLCRKSPKYLPILVEHSLNTFKFINRGICLRVDTRSTLYNVLYRW